MNNRNNSGPNNNNNNHHNNNSRIIGVFKEGREMKALVAMYEMPPLWHLPTGQFVSLIQNTHLTEMFECEINSFTICSKLAGD